MKKRYIITIAAGLGLLTGCGKQENNEPAVSVQLPPVFVEQQIDKTPTPIPEARTAFQSGDEVVLTGLIMGVPHPFVDDRAVFVLGDDSMITPCDQLHGDACPTPWDACCDDPQQRMKGSATIQVLDENGRPANMGLKGINGLSELSRVTVVGVVAENASPEAFMVNAHAIHVGEGIAHSAIKEEFAEWLSK